MLDLIPFWTEKGVFSFLSYSILMHLVILFIIFNHFNYFDQITLGGFNVPTRPALLFSKFCQNMVKFIKPTRCAEPWLRGLADLIEAQKMKI